MPSKKGSRSGGGGKSYAIGRERTGKKSPLAKQLKRAKKQAAPKRSGAK